MSKLNEKLRILLANQELTQAKLACMMNVAPSTVQKWVSGDNNPTTDTVKELCMIFSIPIQNMLDDNFEIPEYIILDRYLPYSMSRLPEKQRDSKHIIIDAALAKGALLHRFKNASGDDCSAIYQGSQEIWWHYREYESQMIRDWNERAAL